MRICLICNEEFDIYTCYYCGCCYFITSDQKVSLIANINGMVQVTGLQNCFKNFYYFYRFVKLRLFL